jgi:hypothetical protein
VLPIESPGRRCDGTADRRDKIYCRNIEKLAGKTFLS